MKQEDNAILLKVYIGESDEYDGKKLYKYIIERAKELKIAGCTIFRGVSGYGNNSVIHTTSILRLSSDLPVLIEIIDLPNKIELFKSELDLVIKQGLIVEENVKVFRYQ
ncbi:MAG: DUF190 domain-containing protein [Candidatus Heimdallarchaeota archaeon]|nr:DUF190 domain-containing protein [Candidatus Heimdallarchaeota archaeon]